MAEEHLEMLIVTRKTGEEQLFTGERATGLTLGGFWQWACSDLVNNTLRGMLAEYIVACALGIADGTRTEWTAYDLLTPSGIKVEVKSCAYIQSWKQAQLSAITFGIAPTKGWDPATGLSETEARRQADIYVFALLKHRDKRTVDPLNLDQWQFYILPTATLNAYSLSQESIALSTLLRLQPAQASFHDLAATIESVGQDPQRG